MFGFEELPAEFEILHNDNALVANGEEGEREQLLSEPRWNGKHDEYYEAVPSQMAKGFTLKLGAHQVHSITGRFDTEIDVATDAGRFCFLEAVRASLGDAVYTHQVNL